MLETTEDFVVQKIYIYQKKSGNLWLSFYAFITEPYVRGTSDSLKGYASFFNANNSNIGNIGFSIFVDGVLNGANWARKDENLNRWIKVDCKSVIPVNSEYINIFYLYGDFLSSGEMFITDLQLAESMLPTPFTVSERTSTNSLFDLTKNSNLDVYNLNFNDKGIYFDGTSNLYFPIEINSDDFTVTQMLSSKFTKRQTSFGLTSDVSGTSFNCFDWWIDPGGILNFYVKKKNDSSFVSFGFNLLNLVSTEEVFELTIVKEGQKIKTYVNSKLINSYNGNGLLDLINSSFCSIGSRVSGGSFVSGHIGEIYITKLYNRALSGQEVINNFNAIRSRFKL